MSEKHWLERPCGLEGTLPGTIIKGILCGGGLFVAAQFLGAAVFGGSVLSLAASFCFGVTAVFSAATPFALRVVDHALSRESAQNSNSSVQEIRYRKRFAANDDGVRTYSLNSRNLDHDGLKELVTVPVHARQLKAAQNHSASEFLKQNGGRG